MQAILSELNNRWQQYIFLLRFIPSEDGNTLKTLLNLQPTIYVKWNKNIRIEKCWCSLVYLFFKQVFVVIIPDLKSIFKHKNVSMNVFIKVVVSSLDVKKYFYLWKKGQYDSLVIIADLYYSSFSHQKIHQIRKGIRKDNWKCSVSWYYSYLNTCHI